MGVSQKGVIYEPGAGGGGDVAAHEAAADPHPNYLRETFTGSPDKFDVLEVTLPGMTDSPIMDTMKYLDFFASRGNPSYQIDTANRVHVFGFFTASGPLSAWDAHEPCYTPGGDVSSDPDIIGERHFLEVVTRDSVLSKRNVRLLSSIYNFGNSTWTGGVKSSAILSRFDVFQFATSDPTSPIGAAINGAGDADFAFGRIAIRSASVGGSDTNTALLIGPPGLGAGIAIWDTRNPNAFSIGPMSWDRGIGPWGEPTAGFGPHTVLVRHLHLYNASGNVQGFARGDHPTHRFASTDVHQNLFGGIRNDGSLHVVPIAVASLPAPTAALAGTRHFVNNATASTFYSIVAGGGSITVPVFCDGTNWRIG